MFDCFVDDYWFVGVFSFEIEEKKKKQVCSSLLREKNIFIFFFFNIVLKENSSFSDYQDVPPELKSK